MIFAPTVSIFALIALLTLISCAILTPVLLIRYIISYIRVGSFSEFRKLHKRSIIFYIFIIAPLGILEIYGIYDKNQQYLVIQRERQFQYWREHFYLEEAAYYGSFLIPKDSYIVRNDFITGFERASVLVPQLNSISSIKFPYPILIKNSLVSQVIIAYDSMSLMLVQPYSGNGTYCNSGQVLKLEDVESHYNSNNAMYGIGKQVRFDITYWTVTQCVNECYDKNGKENCSGVPIQAPLKRGLLSSHNL